MEEPVEGEDVSDPKQETVSPKVTRPKLPKFSSHTLGHHYRHKTDPGQASEIKNLMEEIKKWKEGSIFDKSPIKPKVVKTQAIPKAHSTHTSPRASPPPSSPNIGHRSSSLNRNRSRSLKLLTDKLKSGRGSSGQTSPNLQVPKTLSLQSPKQQAKGKDTDSGDESPFIPEHLLSPSRESFSEDEGNKEVIDDTETGNKSIVEPIPENDEREDEDEKEDGTSTSSGDTAGTPDKTKQKNELKMKDPLKSGAKAADEDGSGSADSDTPVTHISTFTLHPIDRNSEFLRLRNTAPSKRRPGYAGLTLPKTKIPSFFKSHSDEGKDPTEEGAVKKPNKLDLGLRKSSAGSRFPGQSKLKDSEGISDSSGYIWFSSPSTESLPPMPADNECSASVDSASSAEGQVTRGDDSDYSSPIPKEDDGSSGSPEQEIVKTVESEGEKQEKRNGKSPKQKSKSDPSGNKSFDFSVAGAIISSQSHSFPLLQKEEMDKPQFVANESVQKEEIQTETPGMKQAVSTDSDVLNNNDEDRISELPGDKLLERTRSVSESEIKSLPGSVTDEQVLSPGSEISERMTQSGGIENFKGLESSDISQGDGKGQDETEDIGDLSVSMFSNLSDSSSHPSTPISYSPTGNLEKQTHLLSVPSPKRPILRSVSSASVLHRERKYSGGNFKEKDSQRKHSLTTADDAVSQNETKSMEFLPIGDGGGTTLASSMPAVWNADRLPSMSPERETAFVKDKRYHIVEELYRNEKEYVDALKMLKEGCLNMRLCGKKVITLFHTMPSFDDLEEEAFRKHCRKNREMMRYMDPLKTVSGIEERVIDNIFYMIPEILMHHQIYLEFLNQEWTRWNTDTSTVGDIIQKMFSGQSVQDSYLSFVENYKTSGKVIENAIQTKSSVQKFVEQCQKESGSKLTMKDLIVRPIQRIPRVELLIQRLLVNTPGDHPDYVLLQEAETTLHNFAKKIGHLSEPQVEDGQQETLKKLELLLITDLAVQDRYYLRHDMVQILNKKDQCCIWMFSDLIIISSVRRRSGPVTRKVSIILKSPTGQDFAENVKQKVWLRVGLDDIEIVKNPETLKRVTTMDKEQVEEDIDLLETIQDLTNKLNCNHNGLDEMIKEMDMSLKKQLEEHDLRTSLLDTQKMELLVTTQEGVLNLEVNFNSTEKRVNWETTFLDAKQKLSLLSDKRAPEFLQALPITKTRAGMQFSCASPIDGFNNSGYRDVWVCNSDGYVGHMCLLSLQPEPIVTLNTPVPGCNARILCIGAVPAHASPRRKSSAKHHKGPPSPATDGPRISIEEVDSAITEEEIGLQGEGEIPDTVSEEGYQSESSSSDDSDDEIISTQKLYVDDFDVKRSQYSTIAQSSPDSFTTSGTWTQDPHKSTMWLGTEDGCIHIFQCTDNIKTTKNKLKIQLGYPVFCIIYLDNKVFVSLSNGDLLVYRRDSGGIWDTENPYTRAIGSVTAPIVKMLPVAGKLWCGRQNNICVINPLTLNIETTFSVHSDSNRCVQCIVSSGQGVWIASQQTYKVVLYHATTYEFLMEVSVAQAVNQKLQSADDIIRQHKAACLRITSLLVCKDLLWVGTSAGVILTIPMPKITSTTTRGFLTVPNVTGLVLGHTGHVRFLTCVELSNSNVPPLLQGITSHGADTTNNNTNNNNKDSPETSGSHELHPRRSSVATMTQTLATRMLVISGGDGYEDFRNNVVNESAGKDDSTNHLLLWQV